MTATHPQSPSTEPSPTSDVASNLAAVTARIDQAARISGRDPGDVTLVAISKMIAADRIEAAITAGHRCFGENRVQEAQAKWPELKARYPDIRLHLVGGLQTNKAKDAVALFDVIESVDRPKLAKALAAAMTATGRRPECYVQVNIGEEPQKSGVAPTEAEAFIAACRDEYDLPVTGVMCIPPADQAPAPYFALLTSLAQRTGLTRISMGMSGDFEEAIELGASHVRVGTAIFGVRAPRVETA